jgi:hypothetical protein
VIASLNPPIKVVVKVFFKHFHYAIMKHIYLVAFEVSDLVRYKCLDRFFGYFLWFTW